MNRQDVENSISQNVNDNTTRDISPAKVRAAMAAILDWLEFLELGGTVADLDTIYRKINDSYSKEEVDQAIAAIELTPGTTPNIGANGNWWIGGTDTGIRADYTYRVDYNGDIEGARSGAPGDIYTASRQFVEGTLEVYVEGLLQTPGNDSDYVVLTDQTFRMRRVVTTDHMMSLRYLEKK